MRFHISPQLVLMLSAPWKIKFHHRSVVFNFLPLKIFCYSPRFAFHANKLNFHGMSQVFSYDLEGREKLLARHDNVEGIKSILKNSIEKKIKFSNFSCFSDKNFQC